MITADKRCCGNTQDGHKAVPICDFEGACNGRIGTDRDRCERTDHLSAERFFAVFCK